MLPFIDFLRAILETVSSRNARLFSFSRFFVAVLTFSPFATSYNTSNPVVKADFLISFNDGMTLLATLLKILANPYPLCNTGHNKKVHYLLFVRETLLEGLVHNTSPPTCYLACYHIPSNPNE